MEKPFPVFPKSNLEDTMNLKTIAMLIAVPVIGTACCTSDCNKDKDMIKPEKLNLTTEWDKTFEKSDKVSHKKITFVNHYGITLAADMYIPENAEGKLPAIAVSGPFGAVKEQVSGLYAQTLAERGFIALAFDTSYTGESSGEPRNLPSPEINTEDFSAAVDYLLTRSDVDENKIGIVGICGFGGFGLNAAAMDTRIKATVTSTMYDMTRVSAKGYNDSVSAGDLYKMREQLNIQRTKDARSGDFACSAPLPDKLNGDEPQFVKDYVNYYKTPLGFHKRSIGSNGAWVSAATLSLITQPILAYSDTIKNAVLMIHGEKAHSRYFSEDAFKKLKGNNKELYIVPGANHTDLYYKMDVIPFDRIQKFFEDNLK